MMRQALTTAEGMPVSQEKKTPETCADARLLAELGYSQDLHRRLAAKVMNPDKTGRDRLA